MRNRWIAHIGRGVETGVLTAPIRVDVTRFNQDRLNIVLLRYFDYPAQRKVTARTYIPAVERLPPNWIRDVICGCEFGRIFRPVVKRHETCCGTIVRRLGAKMPRSRPNAPHR